MFSLALLASPALTHAGGLTSEQIQAILSLLSSFGADSTIVTNVKAALTGGTPAPSPSFPGEDQSGINRFRVCNVLQRNLSQGTQGDDVRSLQEFLSEEGHFSTSSATGYFGPMTAQAVAKWQVAQGVQGVGSVGPMTRERIKVRCGCVPRPACLNDATPSCEMFPPEPAGGWCPMKKPAVCPEIYMPVCGQPKYSCPAGTNACPMIARAPKTYSNSCELGVDGATFLHSGECANDLSVASSTAQN